MSRDEIIEDMVRELLDAGEDCYLQIRLCLLAQTADNSKLRDFVCKLFAYTDARRPLLISMIGVSR